MKGLTAGVALAVFTIWGAWLPAAENGQPTDDGQPRAEQPQTSEQPQADDEPQNGDLVWLTSGGRPFRSESAVRFGWWAANDDGDATKVGEFQDLGSSPFWDVDAIFSDGWETIDVTATGLDQEGSSARGYFFSPHISANVEFDRFYRRWDHDPLTGGPPDGDTQVVTEDRNVGEDYAIRVEELKAGFKGRLSDSVKWRVKLWGLHKFGERQANAMAHCFNQNFGGAGGSDNRCHVLSERQRIDWLTLEIEPAVEFRLKNAVVEYSRTMRQFGQSDQAVARDYNHFGLFGGRGSFETTFPFAIVPENTTQVDRLKISVPLTECRQMYSYLYYGDTHNKFRDTHRRFRGFDVRLVDRSIPTLQLTGYAKMSLVDRGLPPFLLAEEEDGEGIKHPVEYTRTRAGITSRWRPFGPNYSLHGLSIRSSYEYFVLDRDFASFEVPDDEFFVEPTTVSHRIAFGPSMRLSESLNTYVRYKIRFNHDPLLGLQEASGALNTNRPEQEHLVEVGGSWMPAYNLLVSGQVGIENRWNTSETTNFTEDNYPIIATVWYAPTPQWSLSAGYGHYTNWIDQDVTIGFRGVDEPPPAETLRANYGGRSQVLSLGARYGWSERLSLNGGFEWSRGSNVFSLSPSTTGADWSLLPGFADVIVETTRYRAGIDYQLTRALSCYFRYNVFDFEDKSEKFNSGTAHFFLAGAGAYY